MNITSLAIPDVILIEPHVFKDERGYFLESFNSAQFSKAIGRETIFVQDNESFSKQGVLRGLHYQVVRPQGKLVRVTKGKVFDVAVDLRQTSSTFGKWVGAILSAENMQQLWVPQGFAHGFYVLSTIAQVQYKVTDFRWPEYERCLRFDDLDININWPQSEFKPLLSDKDMQGLDFKNADYFS